MARVTVEDCVRRIANRFELVMLAAQRSRDISAGAPLSLDRDNDKNPVVALREIADVTVHLDNLRDALIRGLQKHVEIDEPEEDMLDLMSNAEPLGAMGAAVGGEGADAGQADTEQAEVDEAPAAVADAKPDEVPDDQPGQLDADQATEPE